MALKFKVGQRVMLKANKAEGWKAEAAIIIGYEKNGTWMVEVKPHDRHDDGLREVTTNQICPVGEANSLKTT